MENKKNDSPRQHSESPQDPRKTENDTPATTPSHVTIDGEPEDKRDGALTPGPDGEEIRIEKDAQGDTIIVKGEVTSIQSEPEKGPGWIKRFLGWYGTNKWFTIPLTLLLLLVALLVAPATRYPMLAPFVKQNVHLRVLDTSTKRPVSDAFVNIGTSEGMTDKDGRLTLRDVPVGYRSVRITKKQYTSIRYNLEVRPLQNISRTDTLTANGRTVVIKVINRISGAPLAGARLHGDAASATSDSDGTATVILPANNTQPKIRIEQDRYLPTEITPSISADQTKNTVPMTPVGKIYGLARAGNKLDVVKNNLDGSERTVVAAAMSTANDANTRLYTARSWKYQALLAAKTPDQSANLYVIDSGNDSVREIDTTDAAYEPYGWASNEFIYKLTKSKQPLWQPKRTQLLSYNADTKKTTVLDENQASNRENDEKYEDITRAYILDNEIIYSKVWKTKSDTRASILNETNSLISIKPDGSARKIVRASKNSEIASLGCRSNRPQELYCTFTKQPETGKAEPNFFSYSDHELKAISQERSEASEADRPTYYISPNGTDSFWAATEDGGRTLYTGDRSGGNQTKLNTSPELRPYGFYTDSYVLLSKNSGELYITTIDTLKSGKQPVKVADYARAGAREPGYGYSYGN